MLKQGATHRNLTFKIKKSKITVEFQKQLQSFVDKDKKYLVLKEDDNDE